MREAWDKFQNQIDDVEAELGDFLENSGMNSLTLNKSKEFIKAWNQLKKQAESIGKYITPVGVVQVKIPYASQEFEKMWERWKEYLAEQHSELMSSRSELSALEHLEELSEKNEKNAIKYLRYAMANRYRNFFKTDKTTDSKPAQGDTTSSDFG